MKPFLPKTSLILLILLASSLFSNLSAQVIISQYYEGTGTNSWIELTNLGTTSVNTASPQLKLGVWINSGTTGNISMSGQPTYTMNLTVVIPAKGTVLIGNTANGTEIPYLTAASASQTNNNVISFNGNDGVALLNSSNSIIDAFGKGINAANSSYVRKTTVTTTASSFSSTQWTSATISAVQTAAVGNATRLNYHLSTACIAPSNQPTGLVFNSPTSNAISGTYTATAANEYLVVYSTTTLTGLPVNGITYNAGNSIGNGIVANRGTGTSFSISGLTPISTYFISVFALNSTSCTGGPIYKTTAPLNGSSTTIASPCVAPTNQPTSLVFNPATTTSISGSYTTTTADEYLVLYSASSTLSQNPINGTIYNAGNTVGNGIVAYRGIANSFSISGLSSNTSYYVTVYAVNNANCSGGPIYNTTAPLNGANATQIPSCVAPANQATNLVFNASTPTSVSGSFTSSVADEYLVVYSTSALTQNPTDGIIYSSNDFLGNGIVANRGTSNAFSISGLVSNTTYSINVFALNNTNCVGGPRYKIASLSATVATTIETPACTQPLSQPTSLAFDAATTSSISGSFAATTADEYLVIYSTSATLTENPINGTIYNPGNTIGNGIVANRSTTMSFSVSNLAANTAYYVSVFALNNANCSGGPIYNSAAPLVGSTTTLAIVPVGLNYYFGNFHSHSEYSDGTGLPSGDFGFADTANCMDFIGISEHNHVAAGMSLNNWILGRQQAQAATTSTFLAMYGMEWGVISGGGHVLVYGVDQLLGWDAGQYQTYVPKSVYTGTGGLFSTINSFGPTTFATLAHPNNSDYNGIMSTYDAVADDAIVGTAVENGPSTSLDVTYTDFPSSMAYLSFYRNMLARGYHLGPTIDHDNHNVTHGHTATSRTVVLSPSLSENDILSSMRLMRFYATEDCGAYVTFKVNGNQMGSIITAVGAPSITASVFASSTISTLKIYYGVPGSGTNATLLTSTTADNITYTNAGQINASTYYYYLDITEADGKRIITSPIWFTRNDSFARNANSAISEFYSITQNDKVTLKWITTNEIENQYFTVEKSSDNIQFEVIENTNGKGISRFPNNYTAVDASSQNDGLTFYRLTQSDAQGNVVYTETKKVERRIEAKFDIDIYPNPITENSKLAINNTNGEEIQFRIFNLTGQMVHDTSFKSEKGNQEIALPSNQLNSGVYIITLKSGNHVVNAKITKL